MAFVMNMQFGETKTLDLEGEGGGGGGGGGGVGALNTQEKEWHNDTPIWFLLDRSVSRRLNWAGPTPWNSFWETDIYWAI